MIELTDRQQELLDELPEDFKGHARDGRIHNVMRRCPENCVSGQSYT